MGGVFPSLVWRVIPFLKAWSRFQFCISFRDLIIPGAIAIVFEIVFGNLLITRNFRFMQVRWREAGPGPVIQDTVGKQFRSGNDKNGVAYCCARVLDSKVKTI